MKTLGHVIDINSHCVFDENDSHLPPLIMNLEMQFSPCIKMTKPLGPDSLNPRFYHHFWNLCGHLES